LNNMEGACLNWNNASDLGAKTAAELMCIADNQPSLKLRPASPSFQDS